MCPRDRCSGVCTEQVTGPRGALPQSCAMDSAHLCRAPGAWCLDNDNPDLDFKVTSPRRVFGLKKLHVLIMWAHPPSGRESVPQGRCCPVRWTGRWRGCSGLAQHHVFPVHGGRATISRDGHPGPHQLPPAPCPCYPWIVELLGPQGAQRGSQDSTSAHQLLTIG